MMDARPMDSTFKPVLVLMSGRALAFAATFLVPVVLVRVFDQTQFGTYKQLFLISSTLYYIAQFGMAESLFYFVPRTPGEGGKYVLNSLLFLAAAGLTGHLLLQGTGATLSRWLGNPELSAYTSLLGVFLLLMLGSVGLEIVMISRRRYLWASLSYGLSDVLRALLLIAPALLTGRLQWLLVGAVTFAALRLAATGVYLWREFAGQLRPDTARLREQLAYAVPFGAAVLVEILQSNFHYYAVSHHFGAATFAVYAVGCLQIPLVDFLASPAGNVMMVRMSERLRDGRPEMALAVWHDTTLRLALVFFPLVGLLLVSGREIIVVLFTESYLASVPIFMVWSTAMLSAALMTDGVLRVYAETRFILLLNAIRLLLIVGLLNWAVSAFHLVGAVLVTVFAMFVGKGLALARLKGRMRISLAQVLPWGRLSATLAAASMAALPALVLKSWLEIPALPLVLTTGVFYGASYVALSFSFGLISEAERRAIARWLQRLNGSPVHAQELKQS